MKKRSIDVIVLSDVHLGTYGSRAFELVNYLESISPKILVLNGDIIDIWQFSKHYFPESHMRVVKAIMSLLTEGTVVYYVTGNHDEMLRKFKGLQLGNFHIVNKVVLTLPTGKAWIFHGDVFDTTMKHSKWLAKLGGKGYDLLIILNTFINWISLKLGRGRVSLSKKVKDSVKGIIKYVNDFEGTAADIALENKYTYVICGHIHQPKIREFSNERGDKVTYLNSGDWVENMTSLEYNGNTWRLFDYQTEYSADQKLPVSEKSLVESYSYSDLLNELINSN
ncbi:MAG: UDP-2,3-diacylglucosamine diphosphatase [Crocinitomicaceae bacterium]|jgi:UDP-2,3-diacylglucosamine pyrophosphatase LpxH|nr:UDP-2,3-diacylglucosamine diphosphatase [Crocinitomicaceae bacterium]MCF8410706.1 UDP-2,3-diacylglucosamine diphosphatase [Crocinitomicaceae bacterium]MCF8444729.1 UDP-2,3-diacylglucosamine diphosphatase [Crocinitomicaceae bacterium]